MRKHLMSVLFFLFSNSLQELNARRELYRNVAHLKMKLAYLNAIKTFRYLFLSIVGIGASLIFLLVSLMVFNMTLFSFVPASLEAKVWLGFGLAAVYLMIAVAAFSYVFAENKWLRMFNADSMLNQYIKKDELAEAAAAKAKAEAAKSNGTAAQRNHYAHNGAMASRS